MKMRQLLSVGLVTVLAAGCAASSPTTPVAPEAIRTPGPEPDPEPEPEPDPVARYVVTFDSVWSRATHPDDWPDDPHYSGLIGGTHSARVSFWREGMPASPGIQLMAEKGRKSPLDQEVAAAIASGDAEFLLSGNTLSDSPGSVALEFTIGVNFPLVTLVTMVAPSPDWFVGVSGLSLLPDGQWADEVVATVYPWDAGTDSGVTYAAENFETVPAEPIRRLLGFPVAVSGAVAPFGTMTFRRIQ